MQSMVFAILLAVVGIISLITMEVTKSDEMKGKSGRVSLVTLIVAFCQDLK
ncbi:MAG: hypothetical protein ACNFW9_05535 [Candidatus Kerfeldbacteria bacterium]|jgi:hypothetical protein